MRLKIFGVYQYQHWQSSGAIQLYSKYIWIWIQTSESILQGKDQGYATHLSVRAAFCTVLVDSYRYRQDGYISRISCHRHLNTCNTALLQIAECIQRFVKMKSHVCTKRCVSEIPNRYAISFMRYTLIITEKIYICLIFTEELLLLKRWSPLLATARSI